MLGLLKDLKGARWELMCDYSHTGLRQLWSNLREGEAGPAYAPRELSIALANANIVGLLTASVLAILARNDVLQARLDKLAMQYLRRTARAAIEVLREKQSRVERTEP